jgi:quinol monooxygenase YgiN
MTVAISETDAVLSVPFFRTSRCDRKTGGESLMLARALGLITLARIMLAIVVNFEIHPDTETQALAALEANAVGSRTEPGCLKWEWSRHVDEPNCFAIYELYVDRDAIDFHKSSAHFGEWKESTPKFMKEKSSGIYEVSGKDSRPVT